MKTASPGRIAANRSLGWWGDATTWSLLEEAAAAAEREARREIPLWGQAASAEPAGRVGAERHIETPDTTPVTRAEIERKLNDPEGAFQRLRRVMDAWNALWFWPLTDTLNAPRNRLTRSIRCAAPVTQPTRSAARP